MPELRDEKASHSRSALLHDQMLRVRDTHGQGVKAVLAGNVGPNAFQIRKPRRRRQPIQNRVSIRK